MTTSLLVLNTGSSSVKFRLFALDPSLSAIAGGKITAIGGAASFTAEQENHPATRQTLPADTTQQSALTVILDWLRARDLLPAITAAAHRIVHGGTRYAAPVLLTPDVMTYLHTLDPLAPLHQPHNLAGAEMLARHLPDIKHYGCFDTAFHADHDELTTSYALPSSWRDHGIRRYGFHGLSYDWIARVLAADHPHLSAGRVVIAHLGNGASLCALKAGRSIDTTMGMTALDGLPMGTRSGTIDPGIIFYLARSLNMALDDIEHALYTESGLLGLSGLTNDVKTLSDSPDPRAAFALAYFARHTARHVAGMAVSLGGLDGLVFTGGIGENADNVRRDILSHLSFLPPFETHVIPANEERGMAQMVADHFTGEIHS